MVGGWVVGTAIPVVGTAGGSVSRHFGPKTFRHHQTGAEMSGQFGTSARTDTELSRPPANIFATEGRTEERFNITGYYH